MATSNLDMRAESRQIIDRIDERFLAAVYALLRTYDEPTAEPIVGYSLSGEPLYADAAEKEYLRRLEEMKQGDKTSAAQLRREVEQW